MIHLISLLLIACGEEKDDTATEPSTEPSSEEPSSEEPSAEPSSEEPSSEPASPATEPSTEPSSEEPSSEEPSAEPSSENSTEWNPEFSFDITAEQITLEGDILDVVDIDGDGFVDVLSKSSDSALYWNKGTGTSFEQSALLWDGDTGGVVENALEEAYGTLENAQSWSYRYTFGDFNGDGELDVAWTEQFMSSQSVWALVFTTSLYQESRTHEVIYIDTNHINTTKIQSTTTDRFGYFSNSGVFEFLPNSQSSQLIANATMYSYEGYIISRDFDEDGDEDFYILHDGGYGFNEAEIAENDGNNGYTSTVIEEIPFSKELVVDEDEVWIPSSNEIHLLDNDEQWQSILSWESYNTPTIGDFNGDGHLDVITSSCESNGTTGISSWSGNGSGELVTQDCLEVEVGLYQFVQDINNDGKDDIVEQYYDSTLTSYQIRVFVAQ